MNVKLHTFCPNVTVGEVMSPLRGTRNLEIVPIYLDFLLTFFDRGTKM